MKTHLSVKDGQYLIGNNYENLAKELIANYYKAFAVFFPKTTTLNCIFFLPVKGEIHHLCRLEKPEDLNYFPSPCQKMLRDSRSAAASSEDELEQLREAELGLWGSVWSYIQKGKSRKWKKIK